MRSAVLVIDVQRALCEGAYAAFEADKVIERINQVLLQARAAQAPVILIQHESRGGVLDYGTDGWKLAQRLDARPADLHLRKTATDAFHETELQAVLQKLEVRSLVICGLHSEFCVDTTTRRALGLGYPVTLVSDGHSTRDNEVMAAAQITRHHNLTLANITSFGPRVTLVAARDVQFEAWPGAHPIAPSRGARTIEAGSQGAADPTSAPSSATARRTDSGRTAAAAPAG